MFELFAQVSAGANAAGNSDATVRQVDALEPVIVGLSGLPIRGVMCAELIVSGARRSQRLVGPYLAAYMSVRESRLLHSCFAGGSAALAIWNAVNDLSNDIDRIRKTKYQAGMGDSLGQPLASWVGPKERWLHEGKRYARALLDAENDPVRREAIKKNAARRFNEIEKESRRATPFWSDLEALLTSRFRGISLKSLRELSDELSWEEGHLPAATDSGGTSSAAPIANSGARDPNCEHSADFTTVVWYGCHHKFTKGQAACVGLLWIEWERKTFGLGEETIGEAIGSAANRFRLADRFRSKKDGTHPAWGTMIVRLGKGIFGLAEQNRQ